MSSWSSKLERVVFSNSRQVTQSAMHLDPREIAIDVGHSREFQLPSDRDRRLTALRLRIADILTRSEATPLRASERPTYAASDIASLDELFVREETDAGVLHVRRKALSATQRVGRIPVKLAQEAESAMLALLALDPSLSTVDPARALYLDTETTGLSGGAGTVPFLIGLGWFEEGSTLVLEQLFLRDLGEERPMLERLVERMERASMLVSYNGKSFDLPLLRSRAVLARLGTLPTLPHLDLVHVARRVHRHRLRQLTLAQVESEVLGFERINDIGGAEVSSRYWHFLRTGDASALAGVIEHNHWDVVSLAALVGLYGEPLSASAERTGPSEPSVLAPIDWPGLARTLKRAGSLALAGHIAEQAVGRGAGREAIRARGEIAKARGDKAQALADFESLVDAVDDPRLRLELAKLYEHHAKEPLRALAVVRRGTRESADKAARREQRLLQKSRRRQ